VVVASRQGRLHGAGRHSQLILVIPKLDYRRCHDRCPAGYGILFDLRLIDDISKAVKSDKPLPPIHCRTLLSNAIHQAATEKPSAVAVRRNWSRRFRERPIIRRQRAAREEFTLNFLDSDSSWVITTYTDKAERPTDRFTGLFRTCGVYRKSPPALYG